MSLSQIENIVKKFEQIGLNKMDQVQLMNRVDTKFVFTEKDLIKILPSLTRHYYILEVKGTLISKYESLYYDGKNLDFYFNHHRKKLDRFKIRYRKYLSTDLTFLEVKHKKNGRTDKMRIQVNDLSNEMTSDHAEFVKNSGIDNKELVPSLLNRFSRITLVSKNLEERLTLDLNLAFEWKGNKETVDNIIIAELKQNKSKRNSPFYELMKSNQLRPLKISKYCIGIIKMYGKSNIKYNRFKKKLLKIQKIQNYAS